MSSDVTRVKAPVIIGFDPGQLTSFVIVRPLSEVELSRRMGFGRVDIVGEVLWESPRCQGFSQPVPAMKEVEPASIEFSKPERAR